MNLDLIANNHFAISFDVDGGPWLGVGQASWYVDLSTLLRNLAVAGALERARKLWATDWYPNTFGRSAP